MPPHPRAIFLLGEGRSLQFTIFWRARGFVHPGGAGAHSRAGPTGRVPRIVREALRVQLAVCSAHARRSFQDMRHGQWHSGLRIFMAVS